MFSSLLARLLTAAGLATGGTSVLCAQALGNPTDSASLQHLSLGDAIRLAAGRSTASRIAQSRTEQAEARVAQQRSTLLPNLSGGVQEAGRTFNTATFGIKFPSAPGQRPLFDPNGEVAGPVTTVDFRAKLQQSLLDLGARARIRSTEAAARSADLDAVQAATQAGWTAAGAYLSLLRADAQLKARAADSALAAELLDIARQQVTAGVGIALDVTRAQAQVAATHAQLIVARNARARAELDLTRTLGVTPDATISVTRQLDSLPAGDTVIDEAHALGLAMQKRPEVQADEARIATARLSLNAIRAERLPRVDLVADDGVLGINLAHLLPTYTWGLQLSVPFFDGHRRAAQEQEQQGVIKELTLRQRDTNMQVAADVRGAILDLQSAREQVDAARERLRLAEQELSQARDRFNAGVAGNADVITAELALTTSRMQMIDALAGYQAARVTLAHAQGTILDIE